MRRIELSWAEALVMIALITLSTVAGLQVGRALRAEVTAEEVQQGGLEQVKEMIDSYTVEYVQRDCTGEECVDTAEWLPGAVERDLKTGKLTHWGYTYLCDEVLEDEDDLALECEIIREEYGNGH